MPTIPTGKLERELRRLYMRWVHQLPRHQHDLHNYIDKFQRESMDLIERMGGDVARLGALADFPAPKRLDLSLHIGTIYSDMELAAISAQIGLGLNPRETARELVRAGVDKSYRRLERLARTETVRAYWKNAWDSIEGLDIVMVWGAEDGPRTCAWCKERDGMVMESSDLRDHPNGRCTPIPTHPMFVEYKGSVRADGSIYQDPDWDKKLTGQDNAWKPVMTQEEADLWAGESVIQQTMLHGTGTEASESIMNSGFSLSGDKYGRLHGNGVYVTENEATLAMYDHGASLKLKANIKNPVELMDVWIDTRFGDILEEVGDTAQAITEYANRYGYDALIKRGKDGSIDELVVFDPKNLVVIS